MATGTDLNHSENLDQKEEHACTLDNKEMKSRSENLTSNSVSREENETNDGNQTADSAAVDYDKQSHDAGTMDGKGTKGKRSKAGGKDSKEQQKQSRKKKEEYSITFFYLQNVDSARDLLMTSIPAGMKIIDEERIGNVHVRFQTDYKFNLYIKTELEQFNDCFLLKNEESKTLDVQ